MTFDFSEQFRPKNEVTGKDAESLQQIQNTSELERVAEQDSNAEAILQNYRQHVSELKLNAEIGGGMRPEDWNIVRQDAVRASQALREFGYSVASEIIESLDE